MRRHVWIGVLCVLVFGCGDDDDKGSSDTTDTQADSTTQPDSVADTTPETSPDTGATSDDTTVADTGENGETTTPPADLSCLGVDQFYDPGDNDVTVAFTLIGYLSDLPIEGVQVTFCERFDDDCANPVAEIESDAEGMIQVGLPAGFDGHARAEGGGVAPSIQMFDRRIESVPVPDGVPRIVRLINPEELAAVADLYEVTLDPGQGRILATARDCGLIPAAGMTVAVDGAPGPVEIDYTDNRLPDPTATSSDSTGFGGAFNVPPGSYTMTARTGDGQTYGRGSVIVRAGWISAVNVAPHQTTPDLSCDGEPQQPPGIEGSVEGSMALSSFVSGAPVVGAHVKVCAISDRDCVAPIVEADTDEEGIARGIADVGGEGFDGFVEVTGAGLFPTRVFFNPPARARSDRPAVFFLAALTPAEVDIFAQAAGLSVDSELAQAGIITQDCRLQPMHGASLTTSAVTDSSGVIYVANGLPAPDAEATDDTGVVGIFNLATGDAVLRGSFDGEPYGAVKVPLSAGFLHLVNVIPSPPVDEPPEPTEYLIGTADDEFGMFPFPPWDVIDPLTGANVGLSGQFVEALCARHSGMSCTQLNISYSECGSGSPFVLGEALATGAVDACATWAQTPVRLAAGATYGPALQSEQFSPKASLIRDADAPELPDGDDALDGLGVGSIGLVSGFAADGTCLQAHYPGSTGVDEKIAVFEDQALLFASVADGSPPYAWVLVTETDFPPPGTALAHAAGAAKVQADICAGPYALMLNEQSVLRPGFSTSLREDSICAAALIAANSELAAGVDLGAEGASNSSTSNTDFQDIACGQPVPTSDGEPRDFRDLCALDDEIALPTLDCLRDNDLLNP